MIIVTMISAHPGNNAFSPKHDTNKRCDNSGYDSGGHLGPTLPGDHDHKLTSASRRRPHYQVNSTLSIKNNSKF